MSYLPSPEIDFSKMTKDERDALTAHLKTEHAKTAARKLHIEELLEKLSSC